MKEIILSFIVAVLVYNVVWYAYGCRDVLSLMVSVLSFWGCCITAFLRQIYRCMRKSNRKRKQKTGNRKTLLPAQRENESSSQTIFYIFLNSSGENM